ncbi:RcnB family protein [Novosphingobium flavum]|uniref:RcnB family protein n=1 Tax=Novosphingobium flavum TaxID=1778672 RepID=A0A7X1FQ77_9SPHN|nr:RcnB family protein [Novosphingobium flavum]MBC2664955.1 RcnB family protein [Novosphingobium flavum]
MRLISFKKSSGLAALAVGLAALTLPSVASAAPGDRGGEGRGGNFRGSENRGGGDNDRGNGGNGGGVWNRGGNAAPQVQQQAQPQRPQPQVQPQQQAPQARNWGGDRNGADAGRGWGSQRPAEGQRYGRDANSGVVNRPAPAFRNNAPAAQPPQQRFDGPRQVQVQPNRSYADQDRNRSYNREAPRQQQGWDGRQWQGQNFDRNRNVRTAPQQRWDNDRDRDRGGNWSRNWRQDNRYNWQSFRSSNRQLFRMPRYYAPYNNYSYRRLSIGFYLDTLFFSQNYWIDDPYEYRLPPAYGPYRWVRYYDDALLVDIYDGEVVDVIYDFFW